MAFDIDAVLMRMFRLVREAGDYDPGGLYTALFRVGVGSHLAERAVLLTPIALGRRLMEDLRLTYTDTFHHYAGDGRCLMGGRLSEEPIYRRAASLEAERIGARAFEITAFASPEVQAVSHAMVNGVARLDMVRLPLVSFTAEPSMEALIRVQHEIAAIEPHHVEGFDALVGSVADDGAANESGISSVNVDPIPT